MCDREAAEQGGILNVLGDYRAKCLFSVSWLLRDAVVVKTGLMLDDELASAFPGVAGTLMAICRIGFDDKMQQVVFSALTLLENVLAHFVRSGRR